MVETPVEPQQMRKLIFHAQRDTHGGVKIRLSGSFWPEFLFDFGTLKKELTTPIGADLYEMIRAWSNRATGSREFYINDGEYVEHNGLRSGGECPFHHYTHREIITMSGEPMICHEAWLMEQARVMEAKNK